VVLLASKVWTTNLRWKTWILLKNVNWECLKMFDQRRVRFDPQTMIYEIYEQTNPRGENNKLKSVSPSSLFPDRLLVQFRIPSLFVFLPSSTPSLWSWHNSRAGLRPGEGDGPGEKMTRKGRRDLWHRGLMEVQRHREQEPPPPFRLCYYCPPSVSVCTFSGGWQCFSNHSSSINKTNTMM